MPNTFQGFPTVPRLPWDDLYINTYFESIDGYYKVPAGSGAANIAAGYLALSTGLTASSSYRLEKRLTIPIPLMTWSKRREMRTAAQFYAATSSEGTFWIVTGGYGTGFGFGFKMQDGKLYAHTGDGSDETNELIHDYGASGFFILKRLKCIFTPGSSVQFYVDDVLVATITTTLPTTTDSADFVLTFYIDNGTTILNRVLTVSVYSIWQEY